MHALNQIFTELHGCFLKFWYPQIIHYNRVFHYKPSILEYPYFGNPHMANCWRFINPEASIQALTMYTTTLLRKYEWDVHYLTSYIYHLQPPKFFIDTKNDGLDDASPFKYSYFVHLIPDFSSPPSTASMHHGCKVVESFLPRFNQPRIEWSHWNTTNFPKLTKKKETRTWLFCFFLKCILTKFNLDQSESTDQSVHVCAFFAFLIFPWCCILRDNPRSPWGGDVIYFGRASHATILHTLLGTITFPLPFGTFESVILLNFPFGGILLATGRVVFEEKIFHEDHFNRVSFGWTKPGWPLFLLKCTKGIFMFHHLPAARLFKQKTPYPPRFTNHRGCGRYPAGFWGSKGCQFIPMHG